MEMQQIEEFSQSTRINGKFEVGGNVIEWDQLSENI